MANQKKSGMLGKTLLLAAGSIGLYTLLFANEATVTEYFTKGSFYAALPLVTALVFSVVHGAFASNCLEAMGISASKKTGARKQSTSQKPVSIQKDSRTRLEAN